MGNFNLTGVLLVLGIFFLLTGLILSQVGITNPITGNEQSVLALIWNWITPDIDWTAWLPWS